MNTIKSAIALCNSQTERVRKENKTVDLLLKEREKRRAIRRLDTPDECYVVYFWDWEEPDEDVYNEFLDVIEKMRHARIEITEDGNLFQDIETDDEEGCDGEFEYLLSWRFMIDFGGDFLI